MLKNLCTLFLLLTGIAITAQAQFTISGNVYDDGDGGTITATAPTAAVATGLFVNLVRSNTVLGSAAVSTTPGSIGQYTINLSNLPAPAACTLIITTSAVATAAALPSSLTYSAEGNTTSGDLTPNGSISLNVTGTVSGYNFAINQLPTSLAVTDTAANLLGTARFVMPTLKGTDPEGQTIQSVQILTLPNAATMGTLYYNRVPVTANQIISGYISSLLTLDPVNAPVPVTFNYKVIDAGGAASSNTAAATMVFTAIGFPCDAFVRFTRQLSGTGPTTLSYPDFTGSSFSIVNSDTFTAALNASVYYDGYIYAMQQNPTSNTLVELHHDASNPSTNYTVTGLPVAGYNNAGVSSTGIMYILNQFTLYTIDLKNKPNLTATSQACTGISDLAANVIWGDIAVSPSGTIFAWYHPTNVAATAPKGLYRLDPSGANAVFTKVGSSEPKTMGSMVFDNTGNLYAYGSAILNGTQDRFFKIDTITGLVTQVDQPDISVSQSDGCSCAFSVAVQNTSSAACLYPGQTSTNYFTIKNLTGGISISGVTFTDTLDIRFSYNYTTPVSISSLENSLRAIYGPNVTVSFSNENGGTLNGVIINGMTLPTGASTFSLSVKSLISSTFGASENITNYSYLLNLPGNYGTVLKSDDPNTAAIGDGTIIGNPSVTISASAGTASCTTVLIANRGQNYGASYTYEWYLNNVLIPGANAQTYTTSGTGGSYTVKAISADGCISPTSPAYAVQPCISGNVFDDVTADGIVNGTGIGVIGTAQLYATLWSTDATPAVIQSVAVKSDGTYSFPDVPQNKNYTVYLTTTQYAAGTPVAQPTTTLIPTTWANIGEYAGSGPSNDGTPNGIVAVNLVTTSISNVNFGVDSKPTAYNGIAGSQTTPAGTINVTVPAGIFTGSDAGDVNNTGSISSIRITALTNYTSFNVGTVTYYSSALPGTCPTASCVLFSSLPNGLTLATNSSGNPTATINLDPNFTNSSSCVFTYAVVDNAGIESATATATMPFTTLSTFTISGTVFDDANGTTNGLIDGAPIGGTANSLTQMYVYLVNSSNVVATSGKVTLPSTGLYSFTAAAGTYSIVLSTTSVNVGQTAPAVVLPTGWVSTAEGMAGVTDGTPANGVVTGIVITTAGFGGINFGIDNLPTPVGSNVASQANPGDTTSVGVPASAFKGTDAVDLSSSGGISSLKITSFPTGANTITINGNRYTAATFPAGITVPTDLNGLPLQPILVDPSFGGSGDVTIPFSVTDAAGKTSLATTNVVVPFVDITISGIVYHDSDGNTNGLVDGKAAQTIGSNTMYANLVKASDSTVIASVAVGTDGTYTFGTTNGVTTNTTFHVVVTKNLVTVGTKPSTALTNAANTSEGTIKPGDGIPDGRTIVSIGTTNITDVNFGIDILPTSDAKAYTIVQPIAHTTLTLNGTSTQPGPLTGSDPEDGLFKGLSGTGTVVINPTALNGNKLFYNNVQIKTSQTITGYDPALLSVKFDGQLSQSLTFTYSYVDAAGKQSSTPANYTINWTSPLPVILIGFDAKIAGKTSLISWITASEQNTEYFGIERSGDAINFTAIGRVSAAGTSTEEKRYAFTDAMPLSGRNYYRLKMADLNGSIRYSEIRLVTFGNGGSSIALYPNPAHAEITVHGLPDGSALKVFSSDGRLIGQVNNAGNIATLNISQWPSGYYLLNVIRDNKTIEHMRFLKQ